MKIVVRAVAVVCVAARLALADSNQAEQDWNKTKSSTREAELQDFITNHPDSKFADLASRRIDELAWEKVNKNDPDAVRDFVRKHPDVAVDLPPVSPAPPAVAAPEASRDRIERSKQRDSAVNDSIAATLRQYSQAYETRNADDVKLVWPRIPGDSFKVIQRTFKEATSVKMRLSIEKEPEVQGDKATVVCLRAMDTIYDNTKSNLTESLITVRLRRIGQGWVIDQIN